jgi:hypothetical protein
VCSDAKGSVSMAMCGWFVRRAINRYVTCVYGYVHLYLTFDISNVRPSLLLRTKLVVTANQQQATSASTVLMLHA